MLYRLFRLVANHSVHGHIFRHLDDALRSSTRHLNATQTNAEERGRDTEPTGIARTEEHLRSSVRGARVLPGPRSEGAPRWAADRDSTLSPRTGEHPLSADRGAWADSADRGAGAPRSALSRCEYYMIGSVTFRIRHRTFV